MARLLLAEALVAKGTADRLGGGLASGPAM
jgi:hypothetical protein